MDAPLALLLVRNTVRHDARVLREARTLRDLGFRVEVLGVVSTSDREPRLEIEGFPVRRLDPQGELRRSLPQWLRRGRSIEAATATGPVSGAADALPQPAPARGVSLRARAGRLAVTAAYYRQGIRAVRGARPALVHANDYNTMWIGLAAQRLCASRLVYDAHELWADRNGRPEWRAWLLACEWLFVRAADATITASPGYAEEMARRYRVARPTVVRNIPAAGEAPAPASAPQTPLGVYVGGLMPGRGLEQAIEALALVPEVRLELIGPGHAAYRAGLLDLAKRSGVTERVEIREPVAPAEVPARIAGASFGLMLIQPVCRSYELTLPNKLFEYAAAGLPILGSDLTVMGPMIREHDLGAAVAPWDIGAIAAGMADLSRPERVREVAARVRAFAAANTWEREQEVLADVYVPDESRRVDAVYARYRASPARRQSWSALNRGNLAIRRELTDAVRDLAPELERATAILDVGCGSGWWLAWLARRIPASLTGVELLDERVQAARERVPGAEIVAGDARALPFDAARFDVVTLFTALSSLASRADVVRALAEAHRVMAPGGVLLVWEPRLPNPRNPDTLLVDLEMIREAVPGARLTVRTTTVLPPLARRLGPMTWTLYPRLARIPALRSHRLVAVRAR